MSASASSVIRSTTTVVPSRAWLSGKTSTRAVTARVEVFPLNQAREGTTVVVERITEEAEADKNLLEYLWRNEVRPGRRLQITEVAPWAGTITAAGEDRTIALGLPAAGKIWVYLEGG